LRRRELRGESMDAAPCGSIWSGSHPVTVLKCEGPRNVAAPEDQRPEVVFLDPMYPHRQKSALVKKEMRLLRQLVGDDEDASDLLVTALARARRRVVVKRPRLAPTLTGPAPGFQIIAPNTRFDVYPISRQRPAE